MTGDGHAVPSTFAESGAVAGTLPANAPRTTIPVQSLQTCAGSTYRFPADSAPMSPRPFIGRHRARQTGDAGRSCAPPAPLRADVAASAHTGAAHSPPTCSADLPRRHDDRRTRRHGGWGRARRAVARRRPYAGLSPHGRGTNTMSPSVVTNRWVRGEAASADPRVAVRPSERGFVRELCRVHTSWTPRQRPDL